MTVEMIAQLIGSYAFPIVACVAMGWYVKYQTDKNREEISKLNEQHRTEMGEVTKAIENNTIAVNRLCEKLGG